MAESHVISALVKKKAEMEGQILFYQKSIASLQTDLLSIDNTIKIFKPDYKLENIKPKQIRTKNKYFNSKECQRLIIDILRESKKPLASNEIGKNIQKMKAIEISSSFEQNSYSKIISNALTNLFKQGIVEDVGKNGRSKIWKIKPLEGY